MLGRSPPYWISHFGFLRFSKPNRKFLIITPKNFLQKHWSSFWIFGDFTVRHIGFKKFPKSDRRFLISKPKTPYKGSDIFFEYLRIFQSAILDPPSWIFQFSKFLIFSIYRYFEKPAIYWTHCARRAALRSGPYWRLAHCSPGTMS